MGGEEYANGALQHFGNNRAGVSADCFNALRIKGRLLLRRALIHEAHIPLLGSQNTRMIHLHNFGSTLQFEQYYT